MEELARRGRPRPQPELHRLPDPDRARRARRSTRRCIEEPEPGAPFGAKGVGEPPTISSTPAVVAAIRAATGAPLHPRAGPPARHRAVTMICAVDDPRASRSPACGPASTRWPRSARSTAAAVARLALTDADRRRPRPRRDVDARPRPAGRRRRDRQRRRHLARRPHRAAGADRQPHRHRRHRRALRRHARRARRARGDRDRRRRRHRHRASARGRVLHRRGGQPLRARHARQPRLRRAACRSRTRSTPSAIDGAVLGDELDAHRLRRARRRARRVPPHAYVELHIEQGPVLEAEGVDDRRGHRRAGHLVDRAHDHRPVEPRGHDPDGRMRHDAGYVAAAIAVVRARAGRRSSGRRRSRPSGASSCTRTSSTWSRRARRSPSTCATPTTPCSARAEAALDVLCDELARTRRRDDRRAARSPASRRSQFDDAVVDLVERGRRAARAARRRRMPSGAGHDAQMLARVCPAGMVFVPSVGGISHNPAEHTDDDRPRGRRQRAAPRDAASSQAPEGVRREPRAHRRRRPDGSGRADETRRRGGRAPRRAAARRRRPRAPSWSCSPSSRSPRSSPGGTSTTTRCSPSSSARCRAPRPSRCSTRRRASASASTSATPSSPPTATATTRRSLVERDGSDRRRATARCTSPATRSPSRGDRSSTSSASTSSRGPRASTRTEAFGGVVGIAICNDRRWPETYRVLGLQGVELMLHRLQHADPLRARSRPGPPRRRSTTTW